MNLKTIDPAKFRGKTVLLKVDYNVPLGYHHGVLSVVEDTRIQRTIPMITFLLDLNCKIVINSHIGRPEGKFEEEFSLRPAAKHLGELLEKKVKLAKDFVGSDAKLQLSKLKYGEILMLENCRFETDELKNSARLGKRLAEFGDLMVNEAFSVSHRAHSSVAAVADYIDVYPGLAFQREVLMLSQLMDHPNKPFVAVVGGAKISDKVEAIRNLAKIADIVLVGGGVANNFIKAQGIDVCKSYLEECVTADKIAKSSYVEVALELMDHTKIEKVLLNGYIPLPKILYPSDVVAAKDMNEPKDLQIIDLTVNHNGSLDKQLMFLDIGPKTRRLYKEIILQAQTIFWNGPMGVFEKPGLAKGTQEIANAIAKSSATTVLGGGDTINAINHFDIKDRFDYVSAAGGAALEFLSGKILPGVRPCLEL